MKPSKLSQHVFKKGKFITPLNSIPMMSEIEDEKSWTYGRLPEYLWIGLILNQYGREHGLQKLYKIVMELHRLAPDMRTPRMSDILLLDVTIQADFYRQVIETASKETLAPLTLIFTLSKEPEFTTWFYCADLTVEERQNKIIDTMQKSMGHQTHEATDIRFVALYFELLSGKLHLQKEHLDMILQYPALPHSAEEMKMIRPSVRSMEMIMLEGEEANSAYLKDFWRCISEMTECSLFSIQFPQETAEISLYMEELHEIFTYLADLFVSANPLNKKMNVIIGIATYSYKRFKEAYEHNLFNSISGRSCIRVLIENYIMLKYLIKNESSHENIWEDYQLYGIGLYKLILARHRESKELKLSHFDKDYIEALVNEFKIEESIDMDTRYFDQQNIRLKAESVNEKELYGLYYDYDSSFEHGLWGAIRESALVKCNNPAHQYHCVPDVEDKNRLKSVLSDCIMVMNKTILFLNDIYGIPSSLFEEVIAFEI
jgi:hypothetical protein